MQKQTGVPPAAWQADAGPTKKMLHRRTSWSTVSRWCSGARSRFQADTAWQRCENARRRMVGQRKGEEGGGRGEDGEGGAWPWHLASWTSHGPPSSYASPQLNPASKSRRDPPKGIPTATWGGPFCGDAASSAPLRARASAAERHLVGGSGPRQTRTDDDDKDDDDKSVSCALRLPQGPPLVDPLAVPALAGPAIDLKT